MRKQLESAASSGPWWRFGMVWMVIAGPILAIIGSFTSLGFALARPDPVIERAPDVESAGQGAHMPAMQARNHVVTPGSAGAGKR